ncbi:MAG: transcription antitermination factor NusB [Fidelibacterota bacterium]|nr:MAG: transcription antitermination factor NusB [Candidatus Neomarinimicrobiota bacterium]
MALQSLYAANLGGSTLADTLEFLTTEEEEQSTEDAREYGLELATLAAGWQTWLNQVIASKLEHWELGRVTLIDRLILELALVEMVNFDDVPLKVSISEAIEIAKKFSTSDSPGFINGILDALYHDILEGKLSTPVSMEDN